MQTLVYQTEVRQAVEEQGVRPEKTTRIYEIVLKADTEDDFETLGRILEDLKDRARRQGAPIIEQEIEDAKKKAQAAKNN